MFKLSNARNVFAKIVIGTAVSLFASASAFAQSTILVVDMAKVYNDSLVGQHVTRQLQSMGQTTQSQLTSQGAPLEDRYRNLQLRLDGKTEQEVLGDAALTSEVQTFQRDMAVLQQQGAIAQAELQLTERAAREVVIAKMTTIIDQIARERNADVVLERQLVIYGEPADITSTVIARLNSEMTTVPVTRQTLPRQQQQPGG